MKECIRVLSDCTNKNNICNRMNKSSSDIVRPSNYKLSDLIVNINSFSRSMYVDQSDSDDPFEDIKISKNITLCRSKTYLDHENELHPLTPIRPKSQWKDKENSSNKDISSLRVGVQNKLSVREELRKKTDKGHIGNRNKSMNEQTSLQTPKKNSRKT